MLLGLVSDTHGLLRPELFDLFEGVERILHAGDVGAEAVLDDLAAIAPVTAVWGNVDGPDVRRRTSESVEMELGGTRIALVHGHRQDGREALAAVCPRAHLVVYGHSHVPDRRRVGGVWLVNPGSAGPSRFGEPVTAAIAEVRDGAVLVTFRDLLTGETVRLD